MSRNLGSLIDPGQFCRSWTEHSAGERLSSVYARSAAAEMESKYGLSHQDSREDAQKMQIPSKYSLSSSAQRHDAYNMLKRKNAIDASRSLHRDRSEGTKHESRAGTSNADSIKQNAKHASNVSSVPALPACTKPLHSPEMASAFGKAEEPSAAHLSNGYFSPSQNPGRRSATPLLEDRRARPSSAPAASHISSVSGCKSASQSKVLCGASAPAQVSLAAVKASVLMHTPARQKAATQKGISFLAHSDYGLGEDDSRSHPNRQLQNGTAVNPEKTPEMHAARLAASNVSAFNTTQSLLQVSTKRLSY